MDSQDEDFFFFCLFVSWILIVDKTDPNFFFQSLCPFPVEALKKEIDKYKNATGKNSSLKKAGLFFLNIPVYIKFLEKKKIFFKPSLLLYLILK